MDDHDLNLAGTCAAIESLADVDTTHWPPSARQLLRYSLELVAIAQRENKAVQNLARIAIEREDIAEGRLLCMSYQGAN